ncbi:MAG: NAD-specific glutamate dehydrogenase [Candidatus Midichloriaceae bacterium]|jgi:glutamate dehydrogenase|nr:NAD-specific glutamate dehydrogenase [Candidatus Midichloriaceae bacterium]
MNINISESLKNKLESITKFTKNKLLSGFINDLYSDNTEIDLKDFDPKHLFEAANSTFEILKSKITTESKVDYFIDRANPDYAVLQIVNIDIPFLIDSIVNELKLRQIDINLVSHSMFCIERDVKGSFLNFSPEGQKEYVIQIHIYNRYHEEYLDNVVLKLKEILECINYSVEDWLSMKTSILNTAQELSNYLKTVDNNSEGEVVAFLQWLHDNNFVFLGQVSCDFNGESITIKGASKKGLLRSKIYEIKNIPYENELKGSEVVVIRKWDLRSVVHRTSHMDVIIAKKYDAKGRAIGCELFFGLFTSTVYYQSVRNIPFVRQKINQVIAKYGYPETSHNCKELVTALESFPRGEILQMNVNELFATATNIVSLILVPRVKLILRKYPDNKFASCIVFIPEKNYSTEVRLIIENIISEELQSIITRRYVQISEGALTRVQLIVKFNNKIELNKETSDRIENRIIKEVTSWDDELYNSLKTYYTKRIATEIHSKYVEAFDLKYKSAFHPNKAVHDINVIESAFSKGEVEFDLYVKTFENKSHMVHLKIYSPHKEQTLSSMIPLIEHLGLEAIDVETYTIKIVGEDKKYKLYLSHFRLRAKNKNIPITDEACTKTKDALTKIWSQSIEGDGFNSLILVCNLNYREANVLRAYVRYLRQTKYPLSMDYTLQVLLDYPEITKKLFNLFDLKFNPGTKDRKKSSITALEADIKAALSKIDSINEDRAIRSLFEVICATLRTNYYQVDSYGKPKEYLSFKLNSGQIKDLPLPKPFAEIFVYSPRFEGVHLRGGKIARGGLRWSDRPEDFRTEVLGLMKAQMTKNSVIVPVGSKGGFVLKKVQPSDGRDKFMNEGIACYKNFLRGLLDITDNIISGSVVPPQGVIRLDGDDPYLVVAADKGTATFSDYANEVSQSYKFWLDDAFASGGSVGYDHKKMAITARGSWISIARHFEDIGMDINNQEFTCVGIGDMSGDVFGNGMILSNKIKLVSAFNHMHIFLDPNPNAEVSFIERKRLFEMPRSQWSDYDTSVISKGGGIFERKQKSINISPEVKLALDITEDELTPDELIKAILRAPVDLLWNGGIGTYVKAKIESNERIGDKNNDALRINGSEVRAKAIGEGGNLGFTQLGRIECARAGAKINTDFIDNSAGVDCSDHEVNIKIAFSEPILTGKIKITERNAILESMTDEVASLVLSDNYRQNQIISLEERGDSKKLNSHAWLIKRLESDGDLDRAIEFLPSDEDLNKLIKEKGSLTKPEISVLLAYAKNSALKSLSDANFESDKYLHKYLLSYFPEKLVSKYSKFLDKHILANQIISTVLINDLINMLGCTYFHQLLEDSDAKAEDIIRAFVVVRETLHIDDLWEEVSNLNSGIPANLKAALFNRIQSALGRSISWLVNMRINISNVHNTIEFYKSGIEGLGKSLNSLRTPSMKEEVETDIKKFSEYEKAYNIARKIAGLGQFGATFDIVYVANQNKAKVEEAAKIYYKSSDYFHIRWLVQQANSFEAKQHLQAVALTSILSEINILHMCIVSQELKGKDMLEGCTTAENCALYSKYQRFHDYIKEIKGSDSSEALVSKLTIATKYLKDIVTSEDALRI